MEAEQGPAGQRAVPPRDRGRNSVWRVANPSTSSRSSPSPTPRTPSHSAGKRRQLLTPSDSAARRSPRLARSQPSLAAGAVDRRQGRPLRLWPGIGSHHADSDARALLGRRQEPEAAGGGEHAHSDVFGAGNPSADAGLPAKAPAHANGRHTHSPIQFSSMPSSRILPEEKFRFDDGIARSKLPAKSLREQILCEKVTANSFKSASKITESLVDPKLSDTTRIWLMRLRRLECEIPANSLTDGDHPGRAQHARQAFFEAIWAGHRTGALALRKTFTVWHCLGMWHQNHTRTLRQHGLARIEGALEYCHYRSLQHQMANIVLSWTQTARQLRHAREVQTLQGESCETRRCQEICVFILHFSVLFCSIVCSRASRPRSVAVH
jgi:hypothetical protein